MKRRATMGPAAAAAEVLLKYFRVEVRGLEKIPRKGPAVIIANHSGFSGFDAVILSHVIRTRTGRSPRIMAHRGYFEWFDWIRRLAFRFGLRQARVWDALQTLRHGHLLIVFPEGEAGNFKSTIRRYRLQWFHSGFVRMAILAKVRIIPCLIIGAEESFLNWGNLDLRRWVRGLRIPIPVTLFPLPARWKIEFLDPIPPSRITRSPRQARRREFLDAKSAVVRHRMQDALDERLRGRGRVFL